MKKNSLSEPTISKSNKSSVKQHNEKKPLLTFNFAFKKGILVYNLHIDIQGQLSKKQIIVIFSSLFGSVAMRKLLSFFSKIG